MLRSTAPMPKLNRPDNAMYRAVASTARSTFGWPRVAAWCVLRSRYWPTKNAAKLVTTAMTRVTAVSTMALAANTTPRRGGTVSEVQIMPVEYSEVIASVPSPTTISWPSRASPATLSWVASRKPRCAGGVCGQCAATPAPLATAQAMPASTSSTSAQ